MKKIYFTVGPSQIYPTVPGYIKEAVEGDVLSLSHRGEWFQGLYQETNEKLKELLSIPDTHKIYFLGSATEGMERSIHNTVEVCSAHVVTGTFGKKFFEIARDLGKEAEKIDVGVREEIPVSLEFGSAELIAFTHNDTSTGYQMPLEEIYQISNNNPSALIALDTVSSLPDVDVDYTKVDLVLFSVQKGFGLPAGLGVLVVSPRAFEKAESLVKKGVSIGSYHNFLNMEKYAQKHQTYVTPNVLGIYLFSLVLEDMLGVGIEKIRQETREKARMLYDFFESNDKCRVVVKEEKYRSVTTPVVEIEGGSKELLAKLSEKGYVVGAGYGENKNSQIRVANFPAQKVSDIKNLIELMQAEL